MTDPIGVRFISSAVKRDHRELEVLYKGLAQAVEEQDHDAVANLQARFCWELARHLVAVQLFIFPGTEARADAGNTVALRRRGELATIRDSVLEFVHLDLEDDSTKFQTALENLKQNLRSLIRNIERLDLVAIEKALEGEESERMAMDWERTEEFVPGDSKDHKGVPFDTVDALLGASYEGLRKAWKKMNDER